MIQDAWSSTVRRRGLSLRQKLPLLSIGLVVVLIVACVAVAYQQVRAAAIEAAHERLQRLSSETADLVSASISNRASVTNRLLSDPDLATALQTGEATDSTRSALARFAAPSDSGMPVELWSRNGRRIAAINGTALQFDGGTITAAIANAPDSLAFSKFGELRGRGTYWLTAPVRSGNQTLGYVAQMRRVGTAQTEEVFRDLLGDDIAVLFASDSIWMSLGGRVIAPPAPLESLQPHGIYTRDGEEYLAYRTDIGRAPWSVIVDVSRTRVLDRAQSFLRTISIIGFVLVAIGALIAILIAGKVTRPLSEITEAASALALGDFDRRVDNSHTDELGTLADAFNIMAERVRDSVHRAESASRAKSDFLASMSHEIRTPINAMIGYADLLELGLAGPVTERQLQQLQRIKLSGKHLIGLVDDVLDFAKLESGQLRVQAQRGSIADAVATASALLLPLAETKNVHIETRADVDNAEYFADRQRVEQILVNLVSNAVKFTDSGGRITIRWGTEKVSGMEQLRTPPEGWAYIRVEDTGIGISKERLSDIFDPFVQAEAGYTRTKGGSGLGLTISRRLARLMNGEIVVASTPGRGSTFTLWLPAATARSPVPV